jgi:AcrR family transcriptional regulator
MAQPESPEPPVRARRGRRTARDGDDARADIVAAARRELAAHGYDGASLRGIARAAGVDPALVHHYFADKAELFTAAMALPLRPDLVAAEVLRGPRETVGPTLVRAVLTRLDGPAVRDAVIALVRTALGHEFAARLLREFLLREVLHRVTTELALEDGELRASLAASQIVGLVVARYGIRVAPLAQAGTEQVVARVGPVVQWYLLGDADGGLPTR